ncbi:hypothetical protein [Streptococcus suis]|uniref:Bacteriocin n=1 Tax=Streptococcus suis TaxID=1307 RepID=A0A0Z8PE07_STRSU|nr:hypothetical protein [Streptococcus suis]NQG29531.1 hypothetical protein [Streptococcus suis]CYW44000.1 Uncharacterised protein [Streptococcus suis]HEM5998479.1 hypothetical protein [Streptococcus suis]
MNKLKIMNKFVAMSDKELIGLRGGGPRDYDWGYSIGKSIRDGINGTIKFVKKLF